MEEFLNGSKSILLTFETIQLYERLELCSIQPPKPISYDLTRMTINHEFILMFCYCS